MAKRKSFSGRVAEKLDKAQTTESEENSSTSKAASTKKGEKDPVARKKTSIMLKPRILRLFRKLQDQELDATGDHLSYSDIVEEAVEDFAAKRKVSLE